MKLGKVLRTSRKMHRKRKQHMKFKSNSRYVPQKMQIHQINKMLRSFSANPQKRKTKFRRLCSENHLKKSTENVKAVRRHPKKFTRKNCRSILQEKRNQCNQKQYYENCPKHFRVSLPRSKINSIRKNRIQNYYAMNTKKRVTFYNTTKTNSRIRSINNRKNDMALVKFLMSILF